MTGNDQDGKPESALSSDLFDKPFLCFIAGIPHVMIKRMRIGADNIAVQTNERISPFGRLIFQRSEQLFPDSLALRLRRDSKRNDIPAIVAIKQRIRFGLDKSQDLMRDVVLIHHKIVAWIVRQLLDAMLKVSGCRFMS